MEPETTPFAVGKHPGDDAVSALALPLSEHICEVCRPKGSAMTTGEGDKGEVGSRRPLLGANAGRRLQVVQLRHLGIEQH